MDNYLSSRWPKGPGAQPPPVPSLQDPSAQRRPRRRAHQWVITITCIALCVAVLGGVCFWAVTTIAGKIAELAPTEPFDDPRPWSSQQAQTSSSWTADDLPWGDPDPSVTLSARAPGSAVSAQAAYQGILPSLVSVEADHPNRYAGTSLGTGIVVASSGYVITNYHIIDETVRIRVILLNDSSRYFEARVIGFDREFDLAVLKFDPDEVTLTPARLGDSDQLAVGDPVYAVGNPMGYLLGSLSGGLVSALNRDEQQSGSPLGLIQTDAVLNPGSSGGALLNESGQVVGITCSKVTGVERRDSEAIEQGIVLEGMGMAIPITDAIPFLNHILATGRSWRPALGIQCGADWEDGRRGIRVGSVTSASTREAGLREDDLILSANGSDVTTLLELRRVLYRTGVDGELTCTVLRDGQEREFTITLVDTLDQE